MTAEEEEREIARMRERIGHLTAVLRARGIEVAWSPPDGDGLEHPILLTDNAGGAFARAAAARLVSGGGPPP